MLAAMFPEARFVGPAGWAHLLVFGVFLPTVVVRNARRIAGRTLPLPARLVHFRSTTATQLAFLTLSLLVARVQYLALLSPGVPRLGPGLLAGVAMYAAAVLFMRPRWRRAVLRRARVVHLFMPENATERAWWLVVSVLAGVGEEITWRGVQTALLVPVTGSYGLAAVLSAVSFGVAHATQGWRSSAVIVGFGLGFQAVVAVSGSLYIAMAVHVAYDITAGLAYGKLGRELGYVPDL
jgi:membrane protease YdiL (CAAX protease family)